MTSPITLLCLIVALADGAAPAMPSASSFAALGVEAMQDLVIFGENRPILLRLRITIGDRPFRLAWTEAIRVLHAKLDHDGDGKLTVAEAEAGGLPVLAGANVPNAPGRARSELDHNPKDGVISVEELTESLGGASGSFRVQADGLTDRRTDTLFDQIDRDKDGQLTRPELAAIVGTLRKFDRDDNELIALDEVVSAAGIPALVPSRMGQPTRDPGVPSAVGLAAGESPMRLVRLLLKKYDTRSSRGPGKPDSKLSPEEFAIPSKAFTMADTNGDGSLNSEELRKYLTEGPSDAILDVALAAEASGRSSARLQAKDGASVEGLTVHQLAENVVELDVGLIRLDIRVDDGADAIQEARQTFQARFKATDVNQDGYLEESELTQEDGQPSPLSGLFGSLDHDKDGKVYLVELEDYVAKQAASVQTKLALTVLNEGRSLFGMFDMDRDRQLGAREVLDTFTRVSACDRDHDGRIAPDEVPHHIQVSLSRGDLSTVLSAPAGAPLVVVGGTNVVQILPPARSSAGPAWFRRMDRNRDGDVSRREFLGTHQQFDRLDRDHDSLLGPDEADTARPIKAPGD